jgi:hypothetical protein
MDHDRRLGSVAERDPDQGDGTGGPEYAPVTGVVNSGAHRFTRCEVIVSCALSRMLVKYRNPLLM